MFTCNDINLLTFTYYLKFILAFNMTIIPFLYLFINYILILRRKQNNLKLIKLFFKKKLKPTFYLIIFVSLSLILHNMLNHKDNICYIYLNPDVYKEYKSSYYFLENNKIDSDLKNNYLNNILTKKNNSSLTNLIYKQANIIKNDEKDINEDNSIQENIIIEDNFLHENDSNKLNQVYVIDGVFYYPNYVYGNNSTYSGISCPNNPSLEGFNNPYGYNNYFYTRLTKFIEEASRNGYKITMSDQGCRSYNTQSYYYNTMVSGRAAAPGYSLHGFGIASDLEFYHNDTSICSGYRTDYNCPSMGWAHQNAERFGLTFPLINASYKEDWHIEPLYKQKY